MKVTQARRYERSPERVDTRAGHYERKLETKAGEVTLRVPKLRRLPFETAIIERYKRRESSVEEALVEMYLAGVLVRRVEDITEALWGTRVSSESVSSSTAKKTKKTIWAVSVEYGMHGADGGTRMSLQRRRSFSRILGASHDRSVNLPDHSP